VASLQPKLSPRAYTHLGNLPLLSVFDRPLTGWASFLKPVMDRSPTALLIVLLSPLLLITALAVRLDRKAGAVQATPLRFQQ
jgi:lipopolysaccharide/colanic/teichoic acid biosynthesis glycosyltransferase